MTMEAPTDGDVILASLEHGLCPQLRLGLIVCEAVIAEEAGVIVVELEVELDARGVESSAERGVALIACGELEGS